MKKFLFALCIIGITSIALYQCKSKTDPSPADSSTNNNNNNPVDKNNSFNPLSTIPGNNVFNTTVGSINLPLVYTDKINSVRGRCDTSSSYYVITGYFEELPKAKASFNVYFKNKPAETRDYTIIPFVLDTNGVLLNELNDTSTFLKVTELVKTGKTWGGAKGKIKVTVAAELAKVEFNNIRGENLSNFSDTTMFSGNIKCK